MTRPLALLLTATLAACAPAFDLTSGADYLAARAPDDPELRALAAAEPLLSFPARIGVARIEDGRLTVPPAPEAESLSRLLIRARGFGEFVPLAPITLDLAGVSRRQVFGVEQARRLGALQHLDYILLYDVSGASAAGQAAFVDVRNGYLYATAQAPAPAGAGRSSLALARALLPEIEAMLTGLATRANG